MQHRHKLCIDLIPIDETWKNVCVVAISNYFLHLFAPSHCLYAKSMSKKHSFFHVSPVLSVIDMRQKITKKVHWHVVGHLNTHIQMNMHDVRSLFVWHWIVYIYKNKKMTLHHGHCSYKCFTWVSQCMWAWWILFRFHRSIFTSLRDFFMSLFYLSKFFPQFYVNILITMLRFVVLLQGLFNKEMKKQIMSGGKKVIINNNSMNDRTNELIHPLSYL